MAALDFSRFRSRGADVTTVDQINYTDRPTEAQEHLSRQ